MGVKEIKEAENVPWRKPGPRGVPEFLSARFWGVVGVPAELHSQ